MKSITGMKIAMAALALTAGVAGARPALAGTVTVKGSDTMVVLGQRWAEEYMKKHAATTIQVTGGGSGTGISALINGTTDVCEASRAMKDAEKKQLADKADGKPPVETVVARDGLSVYVNDSNPLNELTMAQLKAIFTGKVTNWKESVVPTPRSSRTRARTARARTCSSRSTCSRTPTTRRARRRCRERLPSSTPS